MYFASIVMLRSHLTQHKKDDIQSIQRIRPTRIAARRQREMMIVLDRQENEESVDRVDEEDIDLNGVDLASDETDGFHRFPIVSAKEHLKSQSVWEDDDSCI